MARTGPRTTAKIIEKQRAVIDAGIHTAAPVSGDGAGAAASNPSCADAAAAKRKSITAAAAMEEGKSAFAISRLD
ncbi:hypothetical protein KSP40_PGU022131 [Platanthera guangdongensis]|uniref:SMP domain-containing protein n=1 Tax=Platanthera guangdongensis TaxID=2320717 RepID=A0ABR2ML12_9ASPA